MDKNKNIISEIGSRIAEIRDERGLTQSDLSKMTNIDQANLSKIEQGKYNVSIEILDKILNAMDCNIQIVKNEPVLEPLINSSNTTTNASLENVLNNAFIIKRVSTKRLKEFSYNIIERPITDSELFQLLEFTNLKLSYYDLASVFVGNKFIKDYMTSIPKNSPMLRVTDTAAEIDGLYQHGEYLTVSLNRKKLLNIYRFLGDSSLYNTDYGIDRTYAFARYYLKSN